MVLAAEDAGADSDEGFMFVGVLRDLHRDSGDHNHDLVVREGVRVDDGPCERVDDDKTRVFEAWVKDVRLGSFRRTILGVKRERHTRGRARNIDLHRRKVRDRAQAVRERDLAAREGPVVGEVRGEEGHADGAVVVAVDEAAVSGGGVEGSKGADGGAGEAVEVRDAVRGLHDEGGVGARDEDGGVAGNVGKDRHGLEGGGGRRGAGGGEGGVRDFDEGEGAVRLRTEELVHGDIVLGAARDDVGLPRDIVSEVCEDDLHYLLSRPFGTLRVSVVS